MRRSQARRRPPPKASTVVLAQVTICACLLSPPDAYPAPPPPRQEGRPWDVIVSADTVVDLDGRILEKPANEADAGALLPPAAKNKEHALSPSLSPALSSAALLRRCVAHQPSAAERSEPLSRQTPLRA